MAAVLVAALGLLMARIVRGKPAPLRYGLLLAALVVLGIVPAVAAASRLGGWGAVRISPVTVDRPLSPRPFLVAPAVPRPVPVPASEAGDGVLQPEHIAERAVVPMRVPTFREVASCLLWVWLGGLVFFVGLLIRDLLCLRRLRQSLVPCPSGAAVGLMSEASRSVGLVTPPRLYESAGVPVPVVIGPAKPVVVLPAGMATSLEPEKLSAVLLHEAAHVVHGDLWVGLLQHAVAAVFWWCPPVHRLNRRLADVREEICDDYVISAQGDGFQLAEVLVEMAASLRNKRRLAIGTLGVLDEKPAIEGRVERLVDLAGKAVPMTRMNRMAVAAAGAFGAVALAIVVATTIHAANDPPAAAATASPAVAARGVPDREEPQAGAATVVRESSAAIGEAPAQRTIGTDGPRILTLAGTVVDKTKRPVPGAVVRVRNYQATIEVVATADDQGAFRLTLPTTPLAAVSLVVSAAVSDRSLFGFYRFPFEEAQSPGFDRVRIVIEPTRPAKVNVIDANGKPVEGAQVRIQLGWPVTIGPCETDAGGVATFHVPQSETILSVIALKDHQGFDYEVYSLPQDRQDDQLARKPEFPFESGQTLMLDGASPLVVRAEDARGNSLPGVESHVWLLRKEGRNDLINMSYFYPGRDQTTDAGGSFTIAWFPKWQKEPVTVMSALNGYADQQVAYAPGDRSGTLTVQMQRLVPLCGSVKLPDGKAAAEITVSAHGAGHMLGRHLASVRTDQAGRYELRVAPNQAYMLTIADQRWAARAQSGFVVLPEQEVPDHDFTLRPSTRLHGRVLDRTTSQPVAGKELYLTQQGTPLNDIGKDLLPNAGKSPFWVCPMWQQIATSGSDGGFEFFVAEGQYQLFVHGQAGERVVITDEPDRQVDLRIDAEAPKVLTGSVTRGDTNMPVGDAVVVLYPPHTSGYLEQKAVSAADGRFALETKSWPAYAFVVDKKAGIGAIAKVGAEQTSVELPLVELGSASGRLLTEDGSRAAGGVTLDYGVEITDPKERTFAYRFGGQATTDAEGNFTLPHLVPGWDYECTCNDYPGGMLLRVAKVRVHAGEAKRLGDKTKPAVPKPDVPPISAMPNAPLFRPLPMTDP
jgi:beta-lactamase regulating signal transducer with metallopeptidase domain